MWGVIMPDTTDANGITMTPKDKIWLNFDHHLLVPTCFGPSHRLLPDPGTFHENIITVGQTPQGCWWRCNVHLKLKTIYSLLKCVTVSQWGSRLLDHTDKLHCSAQIYWEYQKRAVPTRVWIFYGIIFTSDGVLIYHTLYHCYSRGKAVGVLGNFLGRIKTLWTYEHECLCNSRLLG